VARKYLTPIDLTGLELTNFKIQNLSSNPSAYGKGHTYFNTTANELRTYDGTNWVAVGGSVASGSTGSRPAAGHAGRLYFDTTLNVLFFDNGTSWVQDGVSQSDLTSAVSAATISSTDALSEGTTNLYYTDSRARSAVSASASQGLSYNSGTGVFSVDYTNLESNLVTDGFAKTSDIPSLSGYIQTGDDASLTSLTLTHNGGNGQNLKIGDDAWLGDVNLSNTFNVKGVEDATAGYISFGTNGTLVGVGGAKRNYIGSDSTDLTLGSNNDIVLKPTSGYAYIGTQLMDGSNRIATIADVNAENYITSVTSPLSVTSGVLSIDLTAYLTSTDAASTYLTQTDASSTYLSQTDASSTYLSQTSASSTYLSQTDASSTYLTQTSASSTYLTQSDASSTYATQTSLSSYLTTSDASSTYLTQSNASSTYLTQSDASSTYLTQSNASSTYLTQSDASSTYLTQSNASSTYLTTSDASSTYLTQSDASSTYLTQTNASSTYLAQGDEYIQSVGSEFSVTSHALALNLDSTLVVNGSNNLAVQYGAGLTTDGSGHLAVDETVIATKSYVDATAQGLSVLGSVKMASTVNLNINGNNSGAIDGVYPANGDRVLVKNQTTATENGIYIYNSSSQRLVASTNPEDTDLKKGSFVFIESGSQAAQGWIITGYSAGASTWTQFSAAGEYTAGNGINIASGVISAVVQGTEGMQLTSSGIGINAGTGLEFDGGTGAIKVTDYNRLVKKFAANIGDGTNTSYAVTHNLGTRDVEVAVYDAATYEEVVTDITRTSTNVVTIGFAVAPTTNAYRVVVHA
jgi:uncharacterized protein YjbI with pentapeptide repeats